MKVFKEDGKYLVKEQVFVLDYPSVTEVIQGTVSKTVANELVEHEDRIHNLLFYMLEGKEFFLFNDTIDIMSHIEDSLSLQYKKKLFSILDEKEHILYIKILTDLGACLTKFVLDNFDFVNKGRISFQPKFSFFHEKKGYVGTCDLVVTLDENPHPLYTPKKHVLVFDFKPKQDIQLAAYADYFQTDMAYLMYEDGFRKIDLQTNKKTWNSLLTNYLNKEETKKTLKPRKEN